MILPKGYHEQDFAHQFSRKVETIWTFAPDIAGNSIVLPDGRCDLIVKFRVNHNGCLEHLLPIITGPATLPYKVDFHIGDAWMGVRLVPQAATVVWKNRLANARDNASRGRRAVSKLMLSFASLPVSLPDVATLKALLLTYEKTIEKDCISGEAQQLLSLMHLSGGRLTSSELAHRVGLSERHLHRIFSEQVGLAPKMYSNLLRFHRALRLIRDHSLLPIDAAHESGYSDQAHLIRNFRRFGGFSPTTIPMNLSLPGFSAV